MLTFLPCSPKLTYYTCTGQTIQINCRLRFAWCLRVLVNFFYPHFLFPTEYVQGQTMPHCQELALAWVWRSSIKAGVSQSSLPVMLPVSRLISLLSLHRHPNALPCELLLQSKVTVPIQHVIKILVLYRCVGSTCSNLWKSIVSLTSCSFCPVTLISAR